jgi:hypothetical protein
VLRECAKDIGILWKVVLSQRGHHATRIGHRDFYSHGIADGDVVTHPVILHKPCFSSVDDHVHPESTRIETTLRPNFVQTIERGVSHHRQGEQIKKCTDRHW